MSASRVGRTEWNDGLTAYEWLNRKNEAEEAYRKELARLEEIAKISADDGVNSEGFRIMVQPAASAGATLQAIWFNGQFQGVIMPTTPTGSRSTTAEPTGSSK